MNTKGILLLLLLLGLLTACGTPSLKPSVSIPECAKTEPVTQSYLLQWENISQQLDNSEARLRKSLSNATPNVSNSPAP